MKTKRILLLILSLILTLSISLVAVSCGDTKECTEHIDKNGDGICDDCNASAPTAHVHSDKNSDYKCDGCKASLIPAEHDCIDKNEDLECDICHEDVKPPKHTHTDANDDQVCDECEADLSKNLDGITVVKTTSHDRIRTVHPGEDVTYTFTLTSTANKDKKVEIVDTIPGITSYVSGDGAKQGNSLTFNVTVPAGKTVSVSYTVRVPDSSTLRGSAITSGSAMANGKSIDSPTLYVANTYNAHDMQRLVLALYATRGSDFDAKDVLSSHQRIAFSLTNPITHNADGVATAVFLDTTAENAEKYATMVVPGLYGGTKIDASDIPDLVPILAVAASVARGKTEIVGAERLRLKESDRIESVCATLKALGADITATQDGMTVHGKSALRGGEVDSYNDHRIAMSAAIASLVCTDEVTVSRFEAINKSYPTFADNFQ